MFISLSVGCEIVFTYNKKVANGLEREEKGILEVSWEAGTAKRCARPWISGWVQNRHKEKMRETFIGEDGLNGKTPIVQLLAGWEENGFY